MKMKIISEIFRIKIKI